MVLRDHVVWYWLGIKVWLSVVRVFYAGCSMAEEMKSTSSTQLTGSSKKWEPRVGVGSTMVVKIKPYDEVINFGIWQRRMRGVLVQSNLHGALLGLEKKPQDMSEDQWNEIDRKAISAIEMHVTDEVL